MPARRGQLLFAAVALGVAGLLYTAYYFPYPATSLPARLIDVYLMLQAQVAGALIRHYDSSVRVQGTLLTGRFALEIVKDCSAFDVQALLASVIVAFPARPLHKAVGLLVGLFVVQVANSLRIASLYFVGLYAHAQFDSVHEELMPLVLIVLTVTYFMLWLGWTREPKRPDALPS